jgi:hypothetical protein
MVLGQFESIVKLVTYDSIDEDFRKEWCERKRKFGLKKAEQLFDEGKVVEAAKLGLPRAQLEMTCNYISGLNGFEKNLDKAFEFIKLSAEGGDRSGQFGLGCSYICGQGVEKDYAAALKWLELSAEQGPLGAMSKASTGTVALGLQRAPVLRYLGTRSLRAEGRKMLRAVPPPCTTEGSVWPRTSKWYGAGLRGVQTRTLLMHK